jgi:hypothetical protein
MEHRITPLKKSPKAAPLYSQAIVEEMKRARDNPENAPRTFAHNAKSAAQEALAAFKLFAENAPLQAVVEALNMPPAQVRALYREWSTPLETSREVGIASRETIRRQAEAREARQKELRALDADYTQRMNELDRDAPKLKKHTFGSFKFKPSDTRRQERVARELAIKERSKS